MNQGMLISFVVVLTAAVTSGIWFLLRKRGDVGKDVPVEDEVIAAYQTRLQSIPIWNVIFSELQAQLAQSNSLPEMAQGFKHVFSQENVQSSILLAIGPIRDFALLDSLGKNTPFLELNAKSFIISFPEMETDLCNTLAQELYTVLQQADPSRRWWLLRELAPALQSNLSKQYHMPGQGLITPLRYKGTLYGFCLVAGQLFNGGGDLVRDTGERIALTGDMLSTWLRCMAPQLLAGRPEPAPLGLGLDVLATLDNLEQTITSLQEQTESQTLLNALADYSHFSMLRLAETSLLASQTCNSLVRICHADFAMVLIPTEKGKFAVEAIEMDGWSWSRYAAQQGQTTPHRLTRDEHILNAWPDAFAREKYDAGEDCHAVKKSEVFAQANVLSMLDLESVLVKPATLERHCLALLVIGMKRSGGLPGHIVSVTSSVAAIMGMSLKTLQATHERDVAKQALEDSWKVATTLTKQSIEVIGNIAKAHSIVAVRQPEQLVKYAMAIAQNMSLTKVQLYQIQLAAATCDIGMVAIPTNVLRNDSGFTPAEWKIVQAHPRISVDILKDFGIFKEALSFIQSHHERWDGTGYPDQLKEANIPIGARILAVADSYVSMQSKRPYRGAMSAAEALEQIKQGAGEQFDPGVVKALMRALNAEREQAA